MKIINVVRKWFNEDVKRDQFLVEFTPALDPNNKSGHIDTSVVALFPEDRNQRVRYAILSRVDNSIALFPVPNAGYVKGERHGQLVAEHLGRKLSERKFLEAFDYDVEDPFRLLPRESALSVAGKIAFGAAVAAAGLAILRH
jgi:hypothetical protein